MVNNLLEMNSRLDGIEAMLAEDQEDLLGPPPNLAPPTHPTREFPKRNDASS